MNHNTKNTWKAFALIVAITVAVSFGLTSTVKAQDPNQPFRDAQWWVSQTTTTPFGTSYYQSAGPDTGIGVTFTNQGYTGVLGSQNSSTGGMTYAGGLPVYTGPGTAIGNMSYGPLTSTAAALSGMGSTGVYNTAAGYGGIGYSSLGSIGYTGLMGGYTTGSYGYPTAGGYTTSSYGYPASTSVYNTGYGVPSYNTGYGYPATSSYNTGYGYPATSSYNTGYGYPATSSYTGYGYPATSSYNTGYGYPATSSYNTGYGYPATSSYTGYGYPTSSYNTGYGYPSTSSYGYPSNTGYYPSVIY